MLLKELLTDVSFIEVKGILDTQITSIGFDSRKGEPRFVVHCRKRDNL